ncbi:aldose epimerase [Arthrobacter sp. MYb227]|uniref:aldose-1-epimerase n=1 Tax=Arthrobacter sp. MYb227 TaxID=1848601 RepID=UPI000CFE27DF|nr:aldose-1-epimerase [Arthrobacter sp. MYb227]PQZ94795.1 aldose epimerase [Arthrobacter sp. MYb227]
MSTPNGTAIELQAGGYSATVLTVGATLQKLAFEGRDLVLPFDIQQIPPAYSGKTLMPWPNRVTNGTYLFEGRSYQLPVNELSTNSALHGLVLWDEWVLVESGKNHVVLGHRCMGAPGYPFQLELTARYQLDPENGLTVTLTALNTGVSAAPYGVSSHPFLVCGTTEIDEWELSIPAQQVLNVDDRLLPTNLMQVSGTRFDFNSPRPFGSEAFDHAFTGLPQEQWEVSLTNPATGNSTIMAARGGPGGANWLQLYSGELRGRRAVALEPMTCAPNAFNSGAGLIVLEPADSHSLVFGVRSENTKD